MYYKVCKSFLNTINDSKETYVIRKSTQIFIFKKGRERKTNKQANIQQRDGVSEKKEIEIGKKLS